MIQTVGTRKIIQIAVVATANVAESGDFNEYLYALCDDGSLWMVDKPTKYTLTNQWVRIAAVPE